MSNEHFFGKANIYRAVWALLLTLLGFVGGLFWKALSGPDEVVVLNKNALKDTTITIIKFQPDDNYFINLNKLTNRSIQKQYSNASSRKKKNDIDSLAISIANEYQLKFDSLRLVMNTTLNKKPIVKDSLISIPGINSTFSFSEIKRPKFQMPSIATGYTEEKITSYANCTINSTTIKQNDKIGITLDVLNKSTLSKITPLFVDIVEPKTEHSVYLIWSEQYDIKDTKNILTLASDFKRGKYILTIGFYFKSEVNTKYPAFYSRRFNIDII